MKLKRRTPYLVVIIVCAVLLSTFSEAFQPRSIENAMIISGAGIEKSENGKIKLSVQVIKPVKSDSGSSVSSCVVFTGEGNDLSEATRKITGKAGGVPAWSHCEVIIISKELAEEIDISVIIDPFFRANEVKNSALVLLSETSPAEILNSKTAFNSVSAFGIRRLLDETEFESDRSAVTVKDFEESYYSISNAIVLQSITLEEKEDYKGSDEKSSSEGTSKEVVLSSPYIIKNGKTVKSLERDPHLGSKWLKNEISGMMMSVEAVFEGEKKENVSLILFNASGKVNAEKAENGYRLTVSVKTQAEVTSITGEENGSFSRETVRKRYLDIENAVSEEIKNQILSAWNDMKETDTDYCNISEQLFASFGNGWADMRSKTVKDMLDETELVIRTSINITSGGLNKRYTVNKVHN